MEEVHKIIGDFEGAPSLTEVFAIPDSMKHEFYYMLRGMGQMKQQKGASFQGSKGSQGSRSGQYGG